MAGVIRADAEQLAEIKRLAVEVETYARGHAALAIARFDAFMRSVVADAERMGGGQSRRVLEFALGSFLGPAMAFQNTSVKRFVELLQGLDSGRFELVPTIPDQNDMRITLSVGNRGSVKLPSQGVQGLSGPFIVIGLIVVGGFAALGVASLIDYLRQKASQADLIRNGIVHRVTNEIPNLDADQRKAFEAALERAMNAANNANPAAWFVNAAKDVVAGGAKIVADTASSMAAGPIGAIALIALLASAYFNRRRSNPGLFNAGDVP